MMSFWCKIYYTREEDKPLIYAQSIKHVESTEEGYIYALTNFELMMCLMAYNLHGEETHNHVTVEDLGLIKLDPPKEGKVGCVISTHGNHSKILQEIDFDSIEVLAPGVEYGLIDVLNIEKARKYDLVSFIEPGYPTQMEVDIAHRYPCNYHVHSRSMEGIKDLEEYIEFVGGSVIKSEGRIITCKIYHPQSIVKLAKSRLVSKIEPSHKDTEVSGSLRAKYYHHIVSDPLPNINLTSVRYSPY